MFSFRRKPKKAPETPLIRTPSLPELNSQGIPWPEDLVDIRAIRQEPLPEVVPSQGATKTSFQGPTPIPFHKPFRPSTGKREEGPISSLYMAGPPPSAFDTRVVPRSMGRYSQRRQRAPPTFNIMVCCGTYYILDLSRFILPYLGRWWKGDWENVAIAFVAGNGRYITRRNSRPKGRCGALSQRSSQVDAGDTNGVRRNLRVALRSRLVLSHRHSRI